MISTQLGTSLTRYKKLTGKAGLTLKRLGELTGVGWESEMEKRQGEDRREEDNMSTHLQVSTVHTENAETHITTATQCFHCRSSTIQELRLQTLLFQNKAPSAISAQSISLFLIVFPNYSNSC